MSFQPLAFQPNFQQIPLVATFLGPNINNINLTLNQAMSRDFSFLFTGPGLTFAAVGTLPTGLSLSSAGVLSGTPTVLGAYPNILIRATDSGSNTADSNTFTITVSASGHRKIGGGNVGGSNIGTADVGGANIDTPGWWLN